MTDVGALGLPELDVTETDLRGPAFRAATDRGRDLPRRSPPGRHRHQEALLFLPPRMPGLRLAAEPSYGSIQGVYGLESLHLTWD